MAKRRSKWQRGTADLVSIGVGVILLGIVSAGTTAAMIYGREALIREEHYKAAAYILRGHMEEEITALQLVPDAREAMALEPFEYPEEDLDLATDRAGHVEIVRVQCWRGFIDRVDDPRNGTGTGTDPRPDFYRLTMHARWQERDAAENRRDLGGLTHEITMQTSVLVQASL